MPTHRRWNSSTSPFDTLPNSEEESVFALPPSQKPQQLPVDDSARPTAASSLPQQAPIMAAPQALPTAPPVDVSEPVHQAAVVAPPQTIADQAGSLAIKFCAPALTRLAVLLCTTRKTTFNALCESLPRNGSHGRNSQRLTPYIQIPRKSLRRKLMIRLPQKTARQLTTIELEHVMQHVAAYAHRLGIANPVPHVAASLDSGQGTTDVDNTDGSLCALPVRAQDWVCVGHLSVAMPWDVMDALAPPPPTPASSASDYDELYDDEFLDAA